jgi:hemolysin III
MSIAFPQYTLGERVADGCIHVVGVVASVVGACVLIFMAFSSFSPMSIVSVVIYSLGLVAVFASSAAYNLVSRPRLKAILRRFDHAAIYVKIAATYTPFALVKLAGPVGYALLGAVWLIGVAGVVNKLLWPQYLARTSYVLYLAQGWICLAALNPLIEALSSRTLLLLMLGGVLYTVGVAVHLLQKLPYHNAIWHVFVLAGSACHFAAVCDALIA